MIARQPLHFHETPHSHRKFCYALMAQVYSYQHLQEISHQPAASSGTNGAHNLYGTASLLRYLRERPQCLDPELRKPVVVA